MTQFPEIGSRSNPVKQYRCEGKSEDQKLNESRAVGKLSTSNDDDKCDMLYVQLKPKVRWFKPPFSIKIFKWEISFMWAYRIHKAYELKNCIPKSTSISQEYQSVDIQFTCNPYNKEVSKVAEHLKKGYEDK